MYRQTTTSSPQKTNCSENGLKSITNYPNNCLNLWMLKKLINETVKKSYCLNERVHKVHRCDCKEKYPAEGLFFESFA